MIIFNGRFNKGLTLVELMVSLSVFGILTTVGVPGVMSFVSDNKISSTGLNLYSDILYARSEALKRRTSVYICRTDNPQASTPTCGGTARTWTKGWLVFVDGAGGTTGSYDQANDTLLKIGQSGSKNIEIKSSTSADLTIEYSSNGSLNTSSTEAVFSVCDDRNGDANYDEEYGREIRVSAIGRAKIKAKNIGSCELPV